MTTTPPPAAPDAVPDELESQSVVLIPYPKVVFLYPAFLASIMAGVVMLFTDDPVSTTSVVTAWSFLFILAVNLVVISFDFPRATSLTLFFVLVAAVFGAVLLVIYMPSVLPAVTGTLKKLHPTANATFYFVFAGAMLLIYAFVFVNRRFDYWEVRPNELLHHHGVLSDLERFSAPNLRIDKEINDIFEFLLLRSGRLILHPSNERRAIVLENIVSISRKERDITRMLGALQVQVREK